MADMTMQRAQQQVDATTKLLRTRNMKVDADQLDEAIAVLKAQRQLDSSLARMAGNIASGLAPLFVQTDSSVQLFKDAPARELIVNLDVARIAHASVAIARAIIGELQTVEEVK